MKRYIYKFSQLLALSSLVLATACNEDDYQPIDTVSDVAWFTSEVGKHPDVYQLAQGSVVSFMDSSQGTQSHEWIIEDGAQFMVNGFDRDNKDFNSQIDSNKGLTSGEAVENVIFNTPGVTKVTLRNTFNEWVTSHDDAPVEATLCENYWLWEKTFDVEVFGLLKPAFAVKVAGNTVLDFLADDVVPTDKSQWRTVNLEIGQKITLVDNTTEDRPDGRTWSVPNSAQETSTAQEATFSFNKMGTFSGFTLKSTRTKPVANKMVVLPLIVNVTASTADFKASALEVDTNNPSTIIMSANGTFAELGATEKDNFTVVSAKTEDGADIEGITVESVSINMADNSQFQINLSDRLYPGEVVVINYDGNGEIISSDGRSMFDFDQQLTATNALQGGNLIDATISSFGDVGATFASAGWFTVAADIAAGKVTLGADPAGDASRGNCVKIHAEEAIAPSAYIMHANPTVNVPVGSYVVTFDMYVPASCAGVVQPKTFMWSSKNGAAAFKDNTVNFPDLEGGDKWVKASYPVTLTEAMVDGKIKITFKSDVLVAGTTIYIDNVELSPARPIE